LPTDAYHYFGFFKGGRVARALHDEVAGFFRKRGGIVSRRIAAAELAVLTLAVTVGLVEAGAQPASGQTQSQAQSQAQNQAQNNDEILRRAKTKVAPAYPELARRMNIVGTVKIQITVMPNGTVKEARVVGGHPVLAGAALEAAKKWRFEPAAVESSGVIDFKFEPR
jgi:protein TonB